MKNKEELKKVNEVRECTDEELAQVVGSNSRTEHTVGIASFGGNACPYCTYWFPPGTTQQQIDDHINNCQDKPFKEFEDSFGGELPFPNIEF